MDKMIEEEMNRNAESPQVHDSQESSTKKDTLKRLGKKSKKYKFKKIKSRLNVTRPVETEDSDIPCAQPTKYTIHTSQQAGPSKGNVISNI